MEQDHGEVPPITIQGTVGPFTIGEVPHPDKVPPIKVKGTINSYAIGSKISKAGHTVNIAGERNKTVITVYTNQARKAALMILREAGCEIEE